jgi:hypothetical protein
MRSLTGMRESYAPDMGIADSDSKRGWLSLKLEVLIVRKNMEWNSIWVYEGFEMAVQRRNSMALHNLHDLDQW